MYDRFTSRCRRVVVFAQEVAREWRHPYIGTEHLLVGLLDEAEGVGAQALARVGLTADLIRRELEEILPPGPAESPPRLVFTPRAQRVIELSLREANEFGHQYIGTEHLLLGLIREGEGVAGLLLRRHEADLPTVRAHILQLLARPPEG